MRASAGTLLILGELAGALEQTVFLLPEAASSMCKAARLHCGSQPRAVGRKA